MKTPYVHRAAVRDTYRIGQEVTKNPSGVWMIAAQKAICAVAVREGKMRAKDAEAQVARTVALFKHRLGPLNPPPVTRLVARDQPYDVYIGRGGPFGNPYASSRGSRYPVILCSDRETAVRCYREWLLGEAVTPGWKKPTRLEVLGLKGKRLRCACDGSPCHGSVLVELAESGLWWSPSVHSSACMCLVCEQRVADDQIPF